MSKENMVEIEVDLEEEVIEWLEKRAKEDGITMDELVVKILEEELLNK